MSVVGLEPSRAHLRGLGSKDGLAEVLRTELAHQRQARRRKQHLLAYGGGIWDVCHGEEERGGVVAAEDEVDGAIVPDIGFDGG